MRRFTRLTNGFSKKIENHAAMVAIHAVYYNFARIHKTLPTTPAMAAGLSDHVWSLEEIVLMADAAMPKPESVALTKRNLKLRQYRESRLIGTCAARCAVPVETEITGHNS
jgi:hypothetical protein